MAKVEWHRGKLFPRVGFIVTNLRRSAEAVVRFYNGRGLAEQWIKEGKNALKWTRLSCHDFADNQVQLQLFALAYNLGNFLRRLALPFFRETLVADHTPGEVDQDRRQGGVSFTLHHFPNGRGGRTEEVVCGHPEAYSSVLGAGSGTWMKGCW